MGKLRHIKYFLAAFGLVVLLLSTTACALDFLGWDLTSDSPDISSVEIDPAHQSCLSASDCVLVYVDCSGCDCGQPINYMYEDLYLSLSRELCSAYAGPVCEMYCPPANLVCQSGRCGTEPAE
jgi:hypothetical protein